MTSIGGQYQFEHIFGGPQGMDYLEAVRTSISAGAYSFEGLEDVDFLFRLKWDDSVRIVQTTSGAYIVTWNFVEERAQDSPPLGATFFIIERGKLVPVCMFEQAAYSNFLQARRVRSWQETK